MCRVVCRFRLRSRRSSLVGAVTLLALLTGPTAGETSTALPPAAGVLLIARPDLPDPNFFHSVVLLLHYDADGAAGVILNRPTGLGLADALPEIRELGERRDLVYFGGPVSPDVLLLLVRTSSAPKDAEEVLPGVYTIPGLAELRPLLDRGLDEESLRAFAGYAGWAPGQLDAEIERGDWQLYPATGERIFTDQPDELWQTLHRYATSPIA